MPQHTGTTSLALQIRRHLAQTPACLGRRAPRLVGRVVAVAAAAPRGALGRVAVLGVLRVDVLAVDVLGVGDEGAAAVAAAGVPLLEPEELEFLVEEVDEIHDVCFVCGGVRGWL